MEAWQARQDVIGLKAPCNLKITGLKFSETETAFSSVTNGMRKGFGL